MRPVQGRRGPQVVGWRWLWAWVLTMLMATVMATVMVLASPAGAAQLRPDAEIASTGELLPLAYHYDAGGSKTQAEVLALSASAWRPLGQEGANFGFTTGAFWFKGLFRAGPGEQQAYIVEVSNPHLNHLSISLQVGPDVRHLRPVGEWGLGNQQPFDDRPVVARSFAVPVEVRQGEMLAVLVRAESRGAMQVPIQVWPESEFHRRTQARLQFDSVYAGLLVGVMVAHLAMFLAQRRRVFLVHMAWEFAMCFYLMTLNGSAFQSVWPTHFEWNLHLLPIATAMAAAMATLFTMEFVHVRAARAWQRFVQLAMGAAVPLIAVATFFISYRLATQVSVALVMVSVITSAVHSVMGLLEGDRSARFNLSGFGAMYLAGGVQALSKFGVLPSTPLTNFDLVQASSLVEALLVTCGLAMRFAGSVAAPAPAAQCSTPREMERSRVDPDRAIQLDALCGVFDGASLRLILDSEIARAAALRRPLSVALVNLDHFRRFNELQGHAAGDRHLQAVAREIKRLLPRQGDSVARCGGEEFCVVLPDTNLQGAMLVCERIRVGLAALGTDGPGPDGAVTASLGLVSLVPEVGADHTRVLRRASDAMFRAKREGRNRCCRAA